MDAKICKELLNCVMTNPKQAGFSPTVIAACISVVGVIISAAIAAYNNYLTKKSNDRNIYINTITTERTKWLSNVRDAISELMSGALHMYSVDSSKNIDEWNNTMRHVSMHAAKIRLYINPDGDIERKIESSVDKIQNYVAILHNVEMGYTFNPEGRRTYQDECNSEIEVLSKLCQNYLHEQWATIKKEAVRGFDLESEPRMASSPTPSAIP